VKILFILGAPNPFPGAAWVRVGFLAKKLSKEGNELFVLGTFTPTTLRKRGAALFDKVSIFNLIPAVGLDNPVIFAMDCVVSFIVSGFFVLIKRPSITIVSFPPGEIGLGAVM
jgi:hypothetical protein